MLAVCLKETCKRGAIASARQAPPTPPLLSHLARLGSHLARTADAAAAEPLGLNEKKMSSYSINLETVPAEGRKPAWSGCVWILCAQRSLREPSLSRTFNSLWTSRHAMIAMYAGSCLTSSSSTDAHSTRAVGKREKN